MRLLLLSNYFPPHVVGGYELWCHDMARELSARGHDVTVLTSRGPQRQASSEDSGLEVQRELELEVCGGTASTLRRAWGGKARAARNAKTVRRAIAETRPDAAMIWGMWNVSRSVPVTVEQMLPSRTAYYLADYWPTLASAYVQQLSNPAKHKLAAAAKRTLAAPVLSRLRRDEKPPQLRCEQAVCCSRYLRDALVEAGVLSPRAGVIYGGIDQTPYSTKTDSRTRPPTEPVRLLYFGRVVPEKGVDTAIEAVAILSRRADAPAVELSILGAGRQEYLSHLRRKVSELGVEKSVKFVGEKTIDEIPETLKEFDICVFTSTWPEPFGRTIVEAMLAGLVVIGSDVGGSREIFERYDESIVFRPGDAEDLAARLAHVIRRPDIRQRLQQKGRELAERTFSKLNMADHMERYLTQVVSNA